VINFTTSWTNGLALSALCHHFRPNLFNFKELAAKDDNERIRHAINFAAEHLNIEPLLDVEG